MSIFFWVWLLVPAGAAVWGAFVWIRGDTALDRDVFVMAIATIAFTWPAFIGLLLTAQVPTQPWYYLPPMALTAAHLDRICGPFLFGRPARGAALGILLIATVGAFPVALEKCRVRQTNIDSLAEEVARLAQQNDLVLVSPWYCGITFQRYYKGNAAWASFPEISDLRIHRYDLLKDKLRSPSPIEADLERIRTTLRGGGTVWVVGELQLSESTGPPRGLRPAPREPSGWNSWPYLMEWSREAVHVARELGGQLERVPTVETEQVNPYEKLPLQRIRTR
jgi:hypothetical protein